MARLPKTHPNAFLINLVIDENYNVDHDAAMKCIALLSSEDNMDENTWSIYETFVNKLLSHYDDKEYRIYQNKIKEVLKNKDVKLVRQLCSALNNTKKPKSLNDFVMKWEN